jgi:hypothetical protein
MKRCSVVHWTCTRKRFLLFQRDTLLFLGHHELACEKNNLITSASIVMPVNPQFLFVSRDLSDGRFAAKSRTSALKFPCSSFTPIWGNYTAIARRHCVSSDLLCTANYTHNMSARAFTLPIRAFTRPQVAQQAERYTCRRCLHTTPAQAQETLPVQIDAQAPILPPMDPSDATVELTQTKAYNPALNFSQRGYSLTKTDRLVKRILPHSIRPQMLQHVDPAKLHGRERDAALKTTKHHDIVGVVVRTGKMDKTVSVRVAGRRYEPRIGKVC